MDIMDIEDLKRRAGIQEQENPDIVGDVFRAIDLISILNSHLMELSDYEKKRLEQNLSGRDLDSERIKKSLAVAGKMLRDKA